MGLIKDINGPTTNSDTSASAYFFDIITQFLSICQHTSSDSEKTLTLVARSADSGIARAVYHFRDEIKAENIHLKAIFTQINTSKDLSNWLSSEQSPLGKSLAKNLRWAKAPALTNAHEQLTLNNICNWSGESMRRDINARFGYYIFDADCKKAAVLGKTAFKALWRTSEPLPQSLLKNALDRETGLYSLQSEAMSFNSTENAPSSPEFTRH